MNDTQTVFASRTVWSNIIGLGALVLSVTGYNNQPISAMTTPTLTTVNQNIDTTIMTAAEVLLSQLGGPARAKPIVRMIAGELVVRESTGPAR